MLKFNNQESSQSNDDSSDPNVPFIPGPGDPPYLLHPPTEQELKAVSGGSIGGVAAEVTNEVALELQRRGISPNRIATLAAAWGISKVQAAGIALVRSSAEYLNNQFNGLFGGGGGGNNVITFYAGNQDDGGSGPGGPGGPNGPGHGPNAQDPRLHQHLDANAKPGEVSINIGIKVPAYAPFFKEYVANSSSPLHITCCKIQMPTLTATSLGRFNTRAITIRFIDRVSRAISGQLNPDTFTESNMNNYFNLILEGLSIYYFYESIYAFSYNKTNTHDALIGLRRTLDANTINNLMILRSTLSALPIPPNMVQFVYWMHQNWTIHSLADSPVIKICPLPIDVNTGLPNPARISGVTDDLNNPTNRSITSVLVKSFDEWFKADLPASSLTLEHSADFTTLFANLPGVCINTGASPFTWRCPGVANNMDPVNYLSYTDELEGAIVACLAIWSVQSGSWLPSFITPSTCTSVVGTIEQNRWVWTGSATNQRFQTIYDKVNLTLQRPETTVFTPTFNTSGVGFGPTPTIHNPFSERLLGVNIEAVSEAGMKFLMWLLNFSDVDSPGSKDIGVSPSAPRGKAINDSTKPSKQSGWTKPRKSRNSSNPDAEQAIDKFSKGEL